LSPIPNPSSCPRSPDAREPVSVVILLKSGGGKKRNDKVSNGKTTTHKMMGRVELPCVQGLFIKVKGETMPYQMSMGVSDREAKKKRRKEN
jgi:hypothetical protein